MAWNEHFNIGYATDNLDITSCLFKARRVLVKSLQNTGNLSKLPSSSKKTVRVKRQDFGVIETENGVLFNSRTLNIL